MLKGKTPLIVALVLGLLAGLVAVVPHDAHPAGQAEITIEPGGEDG